MEKKKTTIFEALKAIQAEMPVIGKNKAGVHNARYADMEKVWDTIYPIISKHGFTIYHQGNGDEVKTIAYHESGEKLESTVKISQLDPQKKGAEITYYKRYNLGMIFNIIVADEDKDAVGTDSVTDEKLEQIRMELQLQNDTNELTKYYKQLGSPKEKEILTLFTERKLELTAE